MTCPAHTQERRRLRRLTASATELSLHDELFHNSRVIAKVTSAAVHVVSRGDDAGPLYAALELLIAERRSLRSKVEQFVSARVMPAMLADPIIGAGRNV